MLLSSCDVWKRSVRQSAAVGKRKLRIVGFTMDNDGSEVEQDARYLVWMRSGLFPYHYAVEEKTRVWERPSSDASRTHASRIRGVGRSQLREHDVLNKA